MTKDEVLKLALEALNTVMWHGGGSCWEVDPDKIEQAIAVIKAALAQPAQRPWVGLTDEEIKPMIQEVMVYYGYNPEHSMLTSGAGFYALARAVLAKSKEKNCG